MCICSSQVAQVVKNPPADAGIIRDTGSFPGSEGSLEEEMASHSSFSVEKSKFSLFHIIFTAVHSFLSVFQIISLALLHALTHVHRKVSTTHSIAMNGVRAREVGTFRSLWYHGHLVKLS